MAAGNEPFIEETIIHTGQHYDANMSGIFFTELNIPEPAVNLGVGSGSHGETTGAMLAAAKLHIPVAHVEAGLRSFNPRMPEEINRILTDHISDLLFCPSRTAAANLAAEGVTEGVHQVGDVMYDAALVFGDLAERKSKILASHGLTPKQYALATVHRAENTDDDTRLANIMEGLKSGCGRPVRCDNQCRHSGKKGAGNVGLWRRGRKPKNN